MTHDLVIRGGTVVDGTGAPARTADVAIDDGVITEVGHGRRRRRAASDRRRRRCSSRPASSTSTPTTTARRRGTSGMMPSSWHGVTTVVMGNCGVGFAPVRPADHDRLIELMEGVEDIPGTVLHEGLAWNWQSFAEYHRRARRAGRFDVDVAVQVPHGALRLHVMGERGADREPATADDIDAMGRARARGDRGRRARVHHVAHAQPPHEPGRAHADAHAERRRARRHRRAPSARPARACCRSSPTSPTSTPSSRSSGAWSEASGRPLSFSLAAGARPTTVAPAARPPSRRPTPTASPMRAQVAARARRRAARPAVHAQPAAGRPVYREIAELPLAERVASCATRASRRRMLGRGTTRRGVGGRFRRFDRMFELGDPPDYEPDPTRASPPAPRATAVTPLDLAYDLLLGDDGRAFLYMPLLNYVDGNLDAVARDARPPPHRPRARRRRRPRRHDLRRQLPDHAARRTGAATARAARASTLPLLVHRQCRGHGRDGRPARPRRARARLPGRRQRHRLRPPRALRRPAMVYDLPAGGKRLVQRADGYVAHDRAAASRSTPTASPPARCRAGSCVARSPPLADVGP